MEIKNRAGQVIKAIEGDTLSGADLRDANLSGANLRCANLRDANLRDANLRLADLPAFAICPEEGAFIGWKQLRDGIVAKLLIPAEARRTSSLVGRKCRAEFANVLELRHEDGAPAGSGYSHKHAAFVYRVGEIVRPDSYCDDIRTECASGIHFFITRKEAVDYCC